MEYKEFSAKTVSDAITAACQEFTVTSDRLDYEVVEEGSSGFLGIGARAAVIKAKIKEEVKEEVKPEIKEVKKEKKESASLNTDPAQLCEVAKDFLRDVFKAMNLEVIVETSYNEKEKEMDINLSGDEMGILIGKRGQTLDSVQYLVSLVVNKDQND